MLPGHVSETTLEYLRDFASMHAVNDSWKPMIAAIEQVREHPATPLYTEVFFKNHVKFQYPPSAILFLDLTQRITGFSWGRMINIMNLFSWLCLPAIGVVFYYLFTRVALFSSNKKDIRLPISAVIILTLLSFAAVGSFYPILRSYSLGQIQTPMTLLVGLALVAWQRRQFGLAGFFIGLCCGIKPQWIALIPWAIFRRQWRMAVATTISAGIFLSLSIAAYGMHNVIDYLPVLSFLSEHGESYHRNQSVNGLMNRFLFNGNNLGWVDNAFPAFHPLVYVFTIGSSILILGIGMFWRRNSNPSSFDLAIIMLSLTIASPIAWEHHYGILLPIFALVLPASISQRSFGGWTTAYLWLAFLLTSQLYDGITNHLADTYWNVFQSYLFFGAIMVLILLYRICYLQQKSWNEDTNPFGQAGQP